ncbi:LysR family transcriptional regulator [Halomonas sp. ML-15]|uniref:LysR family transcriptional regulator n=1 Tax=Halomonas sp. ML-15 TaxID=2773305 RepID=UPI00174702D1|nr:LysR family transcriptional regulator [Halomonas sp. ML-15]MBD3898261.1 LysR family transcriptional regulator [Halomonas sp. ML-15]
MLRELQTFIAVAEAGTFAAAGERIGLTQAAVSAQMKRLESSLGVALFQRQGRNARLNARGRHTLQQAQELVRLYRTLGAGGDDQQAATLVSVGAIASVQRGLLPGALARFHRHYPGCRTRVMPGLSMQLVDLVDAGELDMALSIRPPFSLQSDLRWTTLAREPFRLLVPAGQSASGWREGLSGQPFVRYDRASFGGRQVERFLREQRIDVREVCEVDELEAIVELVAKRVGVALVPETAALRRWPAEVHAIDLGGDTFHRDIGLVQRAGGQASEPAWALAELIEQAVSAMEDCR